MAADEEQEKTIHDVIIIGAGPCGLAVAARLCEDTPSAIFTDGEHQRYHWIRRHSNRMSIKHKNNGSVKPAYKAPSTRKYSTLVLDASGSEWMTRWNNLFRTFKIEHLRSPMFFHVDPGDRDGLLAYTHEQHRANELEEIRQCVGKEVSKHHKKKRMNSRKKQSTSEVEVDERDRKDYFVPSRSLFAEHCDCVVDRYGLRKGLIRNEEVKDIAYDFSEDHPCEVDRVFMVTTNKGQYLARTAVLAIGPGNAPSIPGLKPTERMGGACHSMHIRQFPDPSLKAKIAAKKATNVMVVGGGLTSAQISDLAIQKGVTKVWHIMRGDLKVKPFDINLEWMGKFKNYAQAMFYNADSDEDRLSQIHSARNGGSITGPYARLLHQHTSTSHLSLHTHTTLPLPLHPSSYSQATQTWTLTTTPCIPNLPPIDYIYFCTGISTSLSSIPCLQNLLQQWPIEVKGGLPCLTDDLRWRDEVPLFVTGRLAALRVGPGAGNLGGARQAAERCVWGLEEALGNGDGDGDGERSWREDYVKGFGSRFGRLGVEEEKEGM